MNRRHRKRIIKTPKKIGGMFPKRSLTNFDLIRLARTLKITNFRGVFMVDTLPVKPWTNEKGIFNLDGSSGSGTHWVAYVKSNKLVKYFDSSGIGRPPSAFVRYMKNCRITSNHKAYQLPGTNICGQLCLLFLAADGKYKLSCQACKTLV